MSAHVLESLSAYLDGELPAAARRALEAHTRECRACAEHLEQLRSVDALAREEPSAAPEGYFDALPGRIRERLEARPHTRRASWRPPVWAWAAAAALLLAVLTPLTLHQSPVPAPVSRDEPAAAPPPTTSGVTPALTPQGHAAEPDASAKLKTGEEKPQKKIDRLERGTFAPPPPPPRPAPRDADLAKSVPPPAPAAPAMAEQEQPPPPPREQAPPPGFAQQPAAEEAQAAKRENEAAADGRTSAAPAGGAAGLRAEPPRKDEARRSRQMASAESKALSQDAYADVLARPMRTLEEARALRRSCLALLAREPSGPRADELRVRAIEAAVEAYRLGQDPRDLEDARRDGATYLASRDAVQGERVRRSLRATEKQEK